MKHQNFDVTPSMCAAKGISYHSLYAHLHGLRKAKAETAIRYEEALGIPRWVFRPDIWRVPDEDQQSLFEDNLSK